MSDEVKSREEAAAALVRAGLYYLLEQLPKAFQQARLRLGRNDITGVVFPKGDNSTSEVFFQDCTTVIADLKKHLPQASNSIARLEKENIPITKGHAVIIAGDDVYCLVIDVTAGTGTLGVIN